MPAVAGVFRSREAARKGVAELLNAGFAREQVAVLFPGTTVAQVASLSAPETEQAGAGSAIGGVLGAALGAAGGFELGVGITALIPGVGPVLAAGIAGAAILGVGGLIGGAELGSDAEDACASGLPAAEIPLYQDALRLGRSIVVLLARGGDEAQRGRRMLSELGAESIDGQNGVT